MVATPGSSIENLRLEQPCRDNNMTQADNALGTDHAMISDRLCLWMKTSRLSNRPANPDTAKLKTTAQANLQLGLLNRFEGLKLDSRS